MRYGIPIALVLATMSCASDEADTSSGPLVSARGSGAGGSGGSLDAGGAGGSSTGGAGGSAQAQLQPFTSPKDPGPRGILVSISGEALAQGGYAFPPAAPDDVAFVDGWEVKFTRILITVDRLRLDENPDKDPGDPAKLDKPVAQVTGPWAVDLHRSGPLVGKGGETAVPLAALSGQNLRGDTPFDTSSRYAFGFDTVAATSGARNVNLDGGGLVDYADMIAKGYALLYVGSATWKGGGCTPADPVFEKLPKVVAFRIGFRSPTSYVNCQNPDNDPANAFAGEEHQRGISVKANTSVVAQLTLHTDHPFWDSVEHGSAPHFDQIAARYVGVPGTPTAVIEDLVGVDFLGFKDNLGNKVPWRTCVGKAFSPPDSGTMHFDPLGVPVDPANKDGTKLRDYADYLLYNQSTQGHLNADGLCFVKRNYPSPR